jgi:hypothetical protein
VSYGSNQSSGALETFWTLIKRSHCFNPANDQSQHLLTLPEAPIEVVAVVAEVVEAEAVEADEVEEVAIEAGANIEVEDAAVEVEEEVTIALVIGHRHWK